MDQTHLYNGLSDVLKVVLPSFNNPSMVHRWLQRVNVVLPWWTCVSIRFLSHLGIQDKGAISRIHWKAQLFDLLPFDRTDARKLSEMKLFRFRSSSWDVSVFSLRLFVSPENRCYRNLCKASDGCAIKTLWTPRSSQNVKRPPPTCTVMHATTVNYLGFFCIRKTFLNHEEWTNLLFLLKCPHRGSCIIST